MGEKLKSQLIAAGVKNLKAFGYPEVTADNILTDELYAAFFSEMLKDNVGKGGRGVDAAIAELMAACVPAAKKASKA